MASIKLELDGLNALQLSGKAQAIITALTGNADFPAPEPALTVLTTQADDVAAAYATQKQKEADASAATAATDASIETLKASLRTLGAYIQKTSDGDASKILSSGFAVEKDREASKPLAAPEGVNASYGDEPGEIDLAWNPLPGRPTYEAHISDGDTNSYHYADSSTKSKVTLEGLVSGQLYHIKVRGMNPAGPGAFSNPITQRAS